MADTIPDVTKAVADAAISETATAEAETVARDELAPLQSPSGLSRASAVAQPQPRNGPQVEYVTPPFPGHEPLGDSFEADESRTAIGLPDEWSFLPFLCLPDGAHASEEEFIYFHLPPVSTWANYNATVFGLACFRQIPVNELLHKTADLTRTSVQKALVVLASEPILGSVRTKLGFVTQAFFAQRDFSKMDIVETLYSSLRNSVVAPVSDNILYAGLSLRELVNKFKQKTLQLFKLMFLEKRVLFYGPKVEAISSYQYSLISLVPELLKHLHDVGAPNLCYEESMSVLDEVGGGGEHGDLFRAKLRNLGLPLRIFGEGAFFQPYIPLQQIDVIMAPTTKSFLVGTSNSIFLHNKAAAIDAIVNCDKGTIEVIDPALMSALQLTSADKRFIDEISKTVTSTWAQEDDPTLNQQIEFEGSDDDIRARFESYLFSFLISAKLTLSPPEVSPTPGGVTPTKPKDYTTDFNPAWVKLWKKTNNFKTWNEHTSGDRISSTGIGPGHLKEVPSTMSIMSAKLQELGWSSVAPQTVAKAAVSTAAATAAATADTVKSAVSTVADSQSAKNLQSGASQMFASMSGWMSQRKREWSGPATPERRNSGELNPVPDGTKAKDESSEEESGFVEVPKTEPEAFEEVNFADVKI
ncbi:late secretory pathway protein avl9 [Chytriomyces hyalinus]|nr:late secretory pathway protein avl9 [Chytriomyces hyalinus]